MKNSKLIRDALTFAIRKHDGQLRKDGTTPYVCHPLRVATILGYIFKIRSERILVTAILHDVIEDTPTDFDDIAKVFGKEIATWVSLLSKGKRRQEDKREREYLRALKQAPDEVKLIKLADILDNILDAPTSLSEDTLSKTLLKAERYLNLFL